MSEPQNKKTAWKPFLLGCLFGVLITIWVTISGVVVGAKTLKFWIAKKEVASLKIPKIQTSHLFDYSASAIDIDGKEIPFSHFRGKPIFILVWHPECVHCLSTLMTVQPLSDSIKDFDIPVLALTEGKKEDIVKVQEELKITIPVLIVKKDFLRSLCGDNVPCGLIVNSQGEIVYTHVGSANWGDTEIVQYFMNLMGK